MPPTTAEDKIYASGFEIIADAIGYQAAYEALKAEYDRRVDSTMRHVFSLEGAAVSEAAAIAKEYPGWNVGFFPEDGKLRFVVDYNDPSPEDQDEDLVRQKAEITRRIDAAFASHNKIPGVLKTGDAVRRQE